jgi:hypothetical protein
MLTRKLIKIIMCDSQKKVFVGHRESLLLHQAPLAPPPTSPSLPHFIMPYQTTTVPVNCDEDHSTITNVENICETTPPTIGVVSQEHSVEFPTTISHSNVTVNESVNVGKQRHGRKLCFDGVVLTNEHSFTFDSLEDVEIIRINVDDEARIEKLQYEEENLRLQKKIQELEVKLKELQLDIEKFKTINELQREEHNQNDFNLRLSNKELKKKIALLKKQISRRDSKIATYEEIIQHLRNKGLLNSISADLLEKSLTPSGYSVIGRVHDVSSKNESSKAENGNCEARNVTTGKGIKYDAQLRAFALTLHFYSPRAYSYVRTCFANCLPHPRTIRAWLSQIQAEPGFTGEAMDAIRIRVQEAKAKGKITKVALAVDDMSLKDHIEFDGNKVTGYVDMGEEPTESEGPEDLLSRKKATHACTYMVTCINDRWKIPCGYFFINSLTGSDRAALTMECINILEAVGAQVETLTFDGHASNIAMAQELGASFKDPFNIVSSFPNPADETRRINVIFDACHMVKLVRNCLGEKGEIYDDNGDAIYWRYIDELCKLQTEEGLRLANRLAKRHIDWRKHKMRVRVAVQTFSNSVADAIEYCMNTLQLPNFQGAGPTIRFVRMIDRLFDVLNSSSPIAKNYKAPLKPENINERKIFLLEAKEYLSNITVTKFGSNILTTPRKIGFLGFLVCISSVIDLYDRLVDGETMIYLLTYKLSQDHLEIFFGCIRQRGGWNNNPTCYQFKAAYKSLIIHNEIRGAESANCIDQCQIKILGVSSKKHLKLKEANQSIHDLYQRHPLYECNEWLSEETRKLLMNEIDFETEIPHFSSLSQFVDNVAEYIAGWVVKAISQHMDCKYCKDALYALPEEEGKYSFINFKTRGGLVDPSPSVVRICKFVESYFREVVLKNPENLNYVLTKKIPVIATKFARENNLFACLDEHLQSLGPFNSHFGDLVQAVANRYLKVRLHHETKVANDLRSSSRSVLNRYIIDQHM